MRDTLHAYLLERPAGATPRELLDLVFTRPGVDAEFGPRFIATLLGADARFAFDSAAGRWSATAHARLARGVDECVFVVVDLETTGGAPARGDTIIEIGALRLVGGRVVDRFDELVHPGRPLPRFISHLTGITPAMLADRPGIGAVLPRFVDFAADSVLVAHNAAFDLAFLNAARLQLDGQTFDAHHLCTLHLARRVLPQLRRRSLDALAAHFGIPLVDRHRALGDARMTAEIFFHFLESLRGQGVVRLDQLLDLQHRAADGRRFVCALSRARVARLPPAPGIYRFTGADGRLLYIGKAKNLRQRVASYLHNTRTHGRKVLDLIRHIHDVEIETAGSELEAALREAEEIRRCQPPYNRLSKHLPQIGFLKLTTGSPFPRLAVVHRLSASGGRYFGPFRSRPAARQAQRLLARLFGLRTCSARLRPSEAATPCLRGQIGVCSMPCICRVDQREYAERVAAAARFFDGEIGAVQAELTRRRDQHSAAQRFEAAARAQRDLDLVRQMRHRQRTMSWIVDRQHFAVMQPAADRAGALVYAVAYGRLIARAAVRDTAELSAVAARIDACRREALPRTLQPQDVEGTIILAAWLRARAERDGYVFPLEESAREQLPEWTAALASLISPVAGARAAELPAPADPER